MKKLSKLIMGLTLLALTASCNSGTYRIHGTTTNPELEGELMFLVPARGPQTAETVDSVVVKNGQFFFEGNVEKMAILRPTFMVRYNTQELLVVTEPGDIYVTMGQVSSGGGTRQNDSLQVWKELTQQKTLDIRALGRGADRDLVTAILDSYKDRTVQMVDNLGDCTLSDFLRDFVHAPKDSTENKPATDSI